MNSILLTGNTIGDYGADVILDAMYENKHLTGLEINFICDDILDDIECTLYNNLFVVLMVLSAAVLNANRHREKAKKLEALKPHKVQVVIPYEEVEDEIFDE